MSEKNYPTQMHEILGVEPGEPFEIEGYLGKYCIADDGVLREYGTCESITGYITCNIINHPERIIRRMRLTEEQVYALEALYRLFGARWLIKTGQGVLGISCRSKQPIKEPWGWSMGGNGILVGNRKLLSCLEWFISQDDPEPLNIVQTLRYAGVDVGVGE
jgi:hypothetical protein